MVGLLGRLRTFQQGDKCIVQDVFRLAVAQPKGASIEDQPGGAFLVKGFRPVGSMGY